MARIKRSFEVQLPSERAQSMFERDITPEMHRIRGFVLIHEQPGQLIYCDELRGPSYTTGRGGDALPYLAAKRFGGRVKVGFAPTMTGTSIEIRGRCERDLHDALERLGTPGYWPETADDPHD